jgi:hypothetical protein
MTDDLVKRLREDVFYGDERLARIEEHNTLHMEAADRIEQLEAALQGIFEEADGDFPDIGDIRFIARTALGEKKDD